MEHQGLLNSNSTKIHLKSLIIIIVTNIQVCIIFQTRGKPKLRLSGYGVELQLKSTEYKSQDDSTPKETEDKETAAQSEEEDENDPQNQIDGFNFGRLKYVTLECFQIILYLVKIIHSP